MLCRCLLTLAAASVCFAAEDAWSKVKELKSGAEIRITRRDGRQPVVAKMDEATDEKLSVVIQNRQMSISRADIDRVEARPYETGPRIRRESKVTASDPGKVTPPYQGPSRAGSSVNSSSGFSFGGKPDFELIYRRQPGSRPAAPSR